jgi:hypothetical protein
MKTLRARRSVLGLVAIAGTLIGALASSSIADEVIMRDGTIHKGKIVSKDRRTVTIDTEIHGISTRLDLDRRRIKSIIESEDQASSPSTDISTPSTNPSLPSMSKQKEEDENKVIKRDGYNLVLEVPLEGTFGEEIFPLGVASSLEWAKEVGVTDVVFRINSGGGYGWAATDMVDIMKEYRGEFKMHMLIESAISASIWPSFNCDTITMAPGSDFGGAVGYTTNNTGSAEVDLKMNSIMSSKLESQADANGHSGYLVRAMILSKAAVYAYKDAGGNWAYSDTTEGIPSNYETIDGPDTVLTLTQKQAVKYGIVNAMTEGNTLEEFCKVHGIEKWDNAGEFGYETIERDTDKCQKVNDRLTAAIRGFNTELVYFNNAEYIRTAGSALNGMKKHLGQYKRQLKEAEKLHMPSIAKGYADAIDVTYWENWIKDTQQDLRNMFRP